MPEYIDKEKLYQYLDNEVEWEINQDRLFALEVVQDEESADVAPVVHGKWIDIYGCFETAECSRCHSQIEVTFNGEANGALWDGFNQFYRFCPNCGAKMDLEDDKQ